MGRLTTCRSDGPPVVLTAREAEAARDCINRILRLGIRDNRLTNLAGRVSVTLRKAARRAEKSAAVEGRVLSGTLTGRDEDSPVKGI